MRSASRIARTSIAFTSAAVSSRGCNRGEASPHAGRSTISAISDSRRERGFIWSPLVLVPGFRRNVRACRGTAVGGISIAGETLLTAPETSGIAAAQSGRRPGCPRLLRGICGRRVALLRDRGGGQRHLDRRDLQLTLPEAAISQQNRVHRAA